MDTDMENRLDDLTNNCSDVTRATQETEMVLTERVKACGKRAVQLSVPIPC